MRRGGVWSTKLVPANGSGALQVTPLLTLMYWKVLLLLFGLFGLIAILAHNLVSVVVVDIIGGCGGTHVLDFVGRKLGLLN